MSIILSVTMRPRAVGAALDALRAACGKWAVEPGPPPAVRVERHSWRDLRAVRKAFAEEYARIVKSAHPAGWVPEAVHVVGTDGEPVPLPWLQAPPEPAAAPKLPAFNPAAFAHLFGLDAQIRLVIDALGQAVSSSFTRRPHVLLHGPPGCGKTELLLAFSRWLGPRQAWHVDAATLSKVGIERELLRRAQDGTLPPWLVLEEVEKVSGGRNAYAGLLAVMDDRGTISRLNGRDGELSAECRVQVLATCNDLARLCKMSAGALASRFAVRVQLPRPGPDALRAILLRACNRPDWVQVVLDYMHNELHDTDPRTGLGLLMGGDRLLDRGPQGFLADHRAFCRG